MTSNSRIGVAVGGGVAVALLLALPAAANAQPPGGTEQPGGQGSTAAQSLPKNVDQDLQKLHAGNRAEIQCAQMAEQRAASPEVKQLASTLAQDHTELDRRIKQVAQEHGVSNLEGQAYQQELSKLENKSQNELGDKTGEAFDLAYTKLMVADHKQDVNKNLPQWTKDAEHANVTQVATMFKETDQTLKKHLELAEQARSAENKEIKGQHQQQ